MYYLCKFLGSGHISRVDRMLILASVVALQSPLCAQIGKLLLDQRISIVNSKCTIDIDVMACFCSGKSICKCFVVE